jgi:isoleucyl-tRNA synthetase
LAEAQVEYREHVIPSISAKFKRGDGALVSLKILGAPEVIIWTTTPWTIPSNLAVVFHPNFKYVVLSCGYENELVCKDRVQGFVQNYAIG